MIGRRRNSPVSEQICLSFSSWRGNFVSVIAPPSSPKLLLISAFQFPPLCKRWVLTYFRLSLRRARGRKDVGEQRRGTAGPPSSVLLPVSPRCGNAESKRKTRPEMMLWLRSLPHELHILMLAKDCLLRELSLLLLAILRHSHQNQNQNKKTVKWVAGQLCIE